MLGLDGFGDQSGASFREVDGEVAVVVAVLVW